MTEETLTEGIRERYNRVQEEIAQAAKKAGRDPESIQLVVVTKKHAVDVLRAAIAAGVKVFGENYPKEAVSKQQALGSENKVEWHMIGHVQSRKTRLVVKHFSFLHSLDRLKVARRIDRFSAELGKKFPVLLEFNVSGEESKWGWDASDESRWDEQLPVVEEILGFENIQVRGLMTMPPYYEDAERTRPYFRKLRRFRDYLQERYPEVEWNQLSMGTSVDFRVAIEEGATFVRVGQAVVGARPA